MTNSLVPGSLAARVLHHMHVARGEFDIGELAETLQVNAGEVRQAVSTLRKEGRVTSRMEDGNPLYRAAGTEPATIPGSGLKLLGARKREPDTAPDTTPTQAAPPVATKPKEASMPAKKGKQEAGSTMRDRITDLLLGRPGLNADEISKALGIERLQAVNVLACMKKDGKARTIGSNKPYPWELTTTGAKAPRKPPRRAQAVAPNLAHYGSSAKPPKAAPRAPSKTKVALAIDADGNVAIDELRLAPPQVAQLVDFLTKSQHLWKGASQ